MTVPDVMLLAAGRGTRMGALGESLPKPLIPVAGLPLIDRAIATCTAEGCRHFVVNVHHRPEPLLAHVAMLERLMAECRFRLSDETAGLLDTGGGLKHALPLIDTDPVLVANTDSFWMPGIDAPLARMTAVLEAGADIVMLVADPERATGFRKGPDLSLAGTIVLPAGEAEQPAIYAGRALIRRAVIEAAPAGAYSVYDLFVAAGRAGRLGGVMLDADWLHVGDPEAIIEAQSALTRA